MTVSGRAWFGDGARPLDTRSNQVDSIKQEITVPVRMGTVQERMQQIRRRKVRDSLNRIDMWREILSEALISGSDTELQSAARIVLEDYFKVGKAMAGVAR